MLFSNIFEKNFTINKSSVNLSIDIDDITVGETGNAIITLDSAVLPGKVKLYINNEYICLFRRIRCL